jgi:hypothetical protein
MWQTQLGLQTRVKSEMGRSTGYACFGGGLCPNFAENIHRTPLRTLDSLANNIQPYRFLSHDGLSIGAGDRSRQSGGAAGTSFIGASGNLVTQVVGQSRACFQRATDGVRLFGGRVGSGCKCALCSPHRYTFE